MTFVKCVAVLIVACFCGAAGLIGGNNISKGVKTKFNYFAYINCNNKGLCGGSVISEYVVLTAAHCLRSNDSKDYGIMVGITSFGERKIYKAEEIIPFPTYNLLKREPEHDVGYIKVQGKIQFNDYVQPIPLATASPTEGEIVTVLGIGPVDNDFHVLIGRLKAMDSKKCKEEYENLEGTICTSEESEIGICIGDSGGPLANSKGELVGIVSYKGFPRCEAGGPVFFTSVVHYKSFIDGALEQLYSV